MSEHQPKIAYELLGPLASRDQMRADVCKKRGIQSYWLPLKKLEVREGFNKRRTYTGIKEFSQEIHVTGIPPLRVDVLTDGRIFIDEGHRRRLALLEKPENEWIDIVDKVQVPGIEVIDGELCVECFVNSKNVTEGDRLLRQVYGNKGVPLTWLEQMDVYNEYKKLTGISNTELGKKVNLSRQSIDNMMLLYEEAPENIYPALDKGLITITAAVLLLRKFSREKVWAIIETAIEENTVLKVKDIENMPNEDGEWKAVGSDNGDVTSFIKKQEETSQENANISIEDGDLHRQEEVVPSQDDLSAEDEKSGAELLEEAKERHKDSLVAGKSGAENIVPYNPGPEENAHITSSKTSAPNPDRQFEKLEEIKDETLLCNDVIATIDKVATMVKKLPGDDGYKNDIDRELHFANIKMADIKEFVKKAEIR